VLLSLPLGSFGAAVFLVLSLARSRCLWRRRAADGAFAGVTR
jgi:hypothetical protein